MKKFSISVEEREQLFHTELVKAGVDFRHAAKAAKVLALKPFDEPLSPEEEKLIQEVCAQWLTQRRRMALISQVLSRA